MMGEATQSKMWSETVTFLEKAGTRSLSPSIFSEELLQVLLILYVPQCEKGLKQSKSTAL